MSYDLETIREDFPALRQKVNGEPLVYLDSAASALKPRAVVDALAHFYSYEASNVHRGVHYLSAAATDSFEQGRRTVQSFLNASSEEEIVFTKGTTESINLVAQSWGRAHLNSGDEVLLSEMEHHSNLVPWHMLAEEKNLKIRYIPVTDQGELDLSSLDELLNKKTKLVSVTHCSNTLGTINPVEELIEKAHSVGAKVLVDAAQSVTMIPVDVQKLNCDFLAMSGHKLFGPYGIGVLFGKREILESMPPYQGGGSMISEVTLEKTTFNDPPFRFEAGTPHIAGVIGLAAALDYIEGIGMGNIMEYEKTLTAEALRQLKAVEGLRLIGDAEVRGPVFSFVIEGTHANDIGEILDQKGVAVRTGHHCTQPLMKRFSVPATVRASFSIYSSKEEISSLVGAIEKSKEMLR